MERAQLSAARYRLHLSLEEVAERLDVSKATVHRWEKKGDIPQPYHLRKLCELYGMTAQELGFMSETATMDRQSIAVDTTSEVLASFRTTYLPLRLLGIVCHWHPARYHELQRLITLELEDNSMNDLNRRDALRFLALLPLEMSGLSALHAVSKGNNEEIIAQCTAGVTACWHLRKGKELTFAANAVTAYIPTLKGIVQTAPTPQRKAAADLLAQCFLLKSTLARYLEASNTAIAYAQDAEMYGEQAENPTLCVLALRTQAAAHYYANHWTQALHVAEKAKYFVETATAPIPLLVKSYIYAGLATYQAHNGQKEDALSSLKNAHTAFFRQSTDEQPPIWIDHNQANLALNDGMTHFHLGLSGKAIMSLTQIEAIPSRSASIHMEALLHHVLVEVTRDDQPRNMEQCINLWVQSIEGTKKLQSQQRMNEALQTYAIMRAVWPGEKRIKDLRDYLLD